MLPSPAESLTTLRDGLQLLIKYLKRTFGDNGEDVALLSSDIKQAICNTASLNYSPSDVHDDDGLAIFQLLQKIELFKVEIVLMKLEGGDSILKEYFESIYKGSRYLQTFLKCPHDANSGKLMLILERVEEVAREAESLHHSL